MKKYLLLLLGLIFCTNIMAQVQIPSNIPTPTASSLGRFGIIPISKYTGKAKISIPLYTLKSGNVSMPISLDYESTGVMMNTLPSWTGENWTLNVGGVITRKINDKPDEWISPSSLTQGTKYPNFGKYCYLKSFHKLSKDIYSGNTNNILYNACSQEYDLEPDIFYFNFLGHHGRFLLDKSGHWRVDSEENFEVIYDIYNNLEKLKYPFISTFPSNIDDKQPKTIAGFKLRDEHGNIYEFGYDNNSIEYTSNFFNQTEYTQWESWYAVSWYLTKVVDKYGNTLFSLQYQRGKFIAQLFDCRYASLNICSEKGWGETTWTESNSSTPISGQLDSPVYLKSVSTETKCANFSYTYTDELRMDKIYPRLTLSELSNGVQSNFKDKPFYYLNCYTDSIVRYQYNPKKTDYFNVLGKCCLAKLDQIIFISPKGVTGTERCRFSYNFSPRMHLVSVIKESSGTDIKQKYTLEYEKYDLLPNDYLTSKTDHWGYFNGKGLRIWGGTIAGIDILSLKQPDQNCLKYGTLSKIKYPTGGVTKIEYESNDFSSYKNLSRDAMVDSVGIGGGLRIKSITNYEDSTLHKVLDYHYYTYKDPLTGKSSGQLFSKPIYYWDWFASPIKSSATYEIKMNRITSIIPLSNSFGPSIGYSYVEEHNSDNSWNSYHFSNIDNSSESRFLYENREHTPSPYDKYTERGYMRGKLLEQDTYQGNSLIKKTTYEYRPESDMLRDTVLACNMKSVYGRGRAAGFHYIGGVYNICYPTCFLKKKVETQYDEGIPSVVTTDYDMREEDVLTVYATTPTKHLCSHLINSDILKGIKTTRGNFSSEVKFVRDLRKLVSASYILDPVSKEYYMNNQFVKREKTIYKDYTYKGRIVPQPLYSIVDYQNVSDTIATYREYTPYGSLSMYDTKDGLRHFYGYTYHDQYLVAEGVCPSSDIPIIQGKLWHLYSFNEENTFNLDQRLSEIKGCQNSYNITIYGYEKTWGLTSITEPNGRTTYFDQKGGYLNYIRDNNKNIIQHFKYNFKQK
ncbi:hypothetical protein L6467_01540 [Segatella bryantii]|uniref:hypothetical protein n=1 Tax=Segatella bryantii TaxID=77095 RepID=UPI001EDB56C7|nr:hypothetical protein [Segatella bryantii]UKK72563.1 hypothetical protein L6467_01540 [Segatella bryantii]